MIWIFPALPRDHWGMSNGTSGDSTPKHVTSVSAGGESVSLDTNAVKAEDRYEQSKDLTNIANRRVRKTFGAIIGARPS